MIQPVEGMVLIQNQGPDPTLSGSTSNVRIIKELLVSQVPTLTAMRSRQKLYFRESRSSPLPAIASQGADRHQLIGSGNMPGITHPTVSCGTSAEADITVQQNTNNSNPTSIQQMPKASCSDA